MLQHHSKLVPQTFNHLNRCLQRVDLRSGYWCLNCILCLKNTSNTPARESLVSRVAAACVTVYSASTKHDIVSGLPSTSGKRVVEKLSPHQDRTIANRILRIDYSFWWIGTFVIED